MLVVGATGPTGRLVLRTLLDQDPTRPVRALIRDLSQRATLPGEVTTQVADVRDGAAVRTALAGVRTVICCLGVPRGQQVGKVRSDGTANLVAQMRAAGVRRLVAVSSIGLGDDLERLTRPAALFWPRLVGADRLAEAARAERAVTGSDLDWTILRPPRLVDAPATTSGTDLSNSSGRPTGCEPLLPVGLRSQLRRDELARLLVAAATDRSTIGKVLTAASRTTGTDHRLAHSH
jgi:nucleoside-diphosphate-sugar epimerase